MAQLARVHADVVAPMRNRLVGPFGFHNGVTNIAVQLCDAFARDGLNGVETRL